MKNINIQTKRLNIKNINIAHADVMFSYRSNPLVYQYQSFRPKSLREVEEFINTYTKLFNIEGNWFQVGIFLDSNLIGDIGIHFVGPNNSQCEIGYTISPEYQNQGYGSEAVYAVVDYLFCDMKKHRIIASVDPRNTPSFKLLEKIGFRKEAHFKKSVLIENEWEDDVIYGLLKEEWDKKLI